MIKMFYHADYENNIAQSHVINIDGCFIATRWKLMRIYELSLLSGGMLVITGSAVILIYIRTNCREMKLRDNWLSSLADFWGNFLQSLSNDCKS